MRAAMGVTGGRLGGRRLARPRSRATRPMSARAREALFAMLTHGVFGGTRAPLAGAVVLDAFCGSGALGLEALSRGAAFCVFADHARGAVATTRSNIKALGAQGKSLVVRRDMTAPGAPPSPLVASGATLAFLSPPWTEGGRDSVATAPALAALALSALCRRRWLACGVLGVVETSRRQRLSLPQGFETLARRHCGDHAFTFIALTRRPGQDNPVQRPLRKGSQI